jgi:hypothetical protein
LKRKGNPREYNGRSFELSTITDWLIKTTSQSLKVISNENELIEYAIGPMEITLFLGDLKSYTTPFSHLLLVGFDSTSTIYQRG